MLNLRQIMPREVLGQGEGLAVGPIQVMTFQLAISTANLDNVVTKFIINKSTEEHRKLKPICFLQ